MNMTLCLMYLLRVHEIFQRSPEKERIRIEILHSSIILRKIDKNDYFNITVLFVYFKHTMSCSLSSYIINMYTYMYTGFLSLNK
jgi:hypothetical protein